MQAVAWRNLKRRRLRSLFTAAAITLGVANVFGVFVTNDSMQATVERRARSATGEADVMASNDAGVWLSDQDVHGLETLPDVRKLMRWSTYKQLEAKGRTEIYLQGIDIAATRELVTVHAGRLPRPGAAEIALSRTAARLLGASIGDRVREATPKKTKKSEQIYKPTKTPDPDTVVRRVGAWRGKRLTFTVTAIVADFQNIYPRENYGSFTSNEFMWATEEPDRIAEVGIMLADGVDTQAWVESAQIALPNIEFQSSEGAPLFRDFLMSFRALLTGTAALALFIGAFLIYLIFTLALAERTRLVGLLHAVGASPRQVAAGVLREALLLGIVATTAGIVFGIALAAGLLRLVADIANLGIEAPVRLTGPPFFAAVVVGIIATLVGAAVPAVRAARTTPVEAVTGRTGASKPPRAWIAGLPLFAIGTTTIAVRGLSSDVVSQIAITGVLLGAVFVVPLGIRVLASFTKGIVTRLVPGSGIVVFRHLTREPGRSAYTLSLVMLVLAAVVALTSATRSLQDNVDRVVGARFGADLIMYGYKIGETAKTIQDIDGVAGAATVTYGQHVGVVSGKGETSSLVLIDPRAFFRIASFPWQEGSDADAERALERRDSVLVPTGLAKRNDLHAGQSVVLRTRTGEHRYEIAGTYGGGTSPEIGVVGNIADERLRPKGLVQSAVYMNFERGEPRRRMLELVARVLREHGGLTRKATWERSERNDFGMNLGPYFAISGAEIKQQARRELDGYVRLFSAVIGVIVVAGALGMATALATSVVLRTRELGTLKAVGATRAHVRRMVLAESLLLTAAAFVLAIGLGAVLVWLFVGGISEITGSSVRVLFAWKALPFVAILALVIAALAASIPSRRAIRISPVEALRYE